MKSKLRLLGALLLCATLALSGCGGGGGSSSGGGTINSGVAVDPYIVGGIFQEINASGMLVQETTIPSDSSGKFSFPAPLQIGNTIVLKSSTGTHGGVPFTGTLKREIDASSNTMVLNPLTTLIANGVPAVDVLALLNAISPGVIFTLADLTADPMDELSDGTMSDADKALLAANMAVNSAVEILGGNIGSLANLTAVANVVAEKLTTQVFDSLTPTSTVAALDVAAATGVTVTNYLVETVVADTTNGTTNTQSVADTVEATYIDEIAALVATNPGQPVIITDPTVLPTPVDDLNALAQIYYAAGKLAYEEGAVSGSTATLMTAIEKFNAAAALTASITDPALKDKVLFFGAFAKVLQVAKPMSDGADNGLNNFGDVLDAFGLEGAPAETDRSNINTLSIDICTTYGEVPYTWQECDLAPLSATSPTSGEMQTMLYNTVGTNLKDAVAMLNLVSPTFGETVNDAGVSVEFDATDAKFISAVANGVLAQINLVQAYDVNVDIDAETNRTTEQTPEQFLATNGTLGKLKDAARLADVKTYSNAAVTALEAAVTALKAETGEQANDFVKFANTNCYWNQSTYIYTCDPTTYNDTAEIADFEAALLETKTILNGSTYSVMGDGEDGIPGTIDDTVTTIDVSKFFAGVDLRSKIPTSFNKGASLDMPGLLPDPTFGGVLVEVDGQAPSVLNTDADGDGSPDIFDMTYFVPGMLQGRSFQTWIDDGAGQWQEWRFNFDSATTFSGTVTYWLPNQPSSQVDEIFGTYTTAQNVLTMDFSPTYGPVTHLVSTLQNGYSEGENGFDLETRSYEGTTLLNTTNHWLQEYSQLTAM